MFSLKRNLLPQPSLEEYLDAAKTGNIYVVENYLASRKNIDAKRPESGQTALMIAAENGHSEIVKMLLESGANPNERDSNKNTALMFASKEGHTKVIEILHKANADLNAININKRAALILASASGKADAVKILCGLGADVNLEDSNRDTALHWAAYKGHAEVIKILIGAKANLELINEDGDTPLIEAAFRGHVNVLETLLCNGAISQINVKNKDGNTPLIEAARKGHCNAINVLLKHGANLNICNNNDHNALHHAAYSGHTEVVELLVGLKININKQDKDGDTPLMLALLKKKYAAAILLIQSGCDVSLRNNKGETAKTINENPEIAAMITDIENGIDSVHAKLISLIQKQVVSKYNSDKVKEEQIKKFTDISSSMILSILRNMQDNRNNVKKFDKLPSILNEISNLLYWMQIDCDENSKKLFDDFITMSKKIAIKIEEDNRKIVDIDEEKNTTLQNPTMLLSPGAPSKEQVLGNDIQLSQPSSPKDKSSPSLKHY